jgi:hypothetical protein
MSNLAVRITEHEIWVFLLGAAIGSIVTYWNLNTKARIISRVRREVDSLAGFHMLSSAQRDETRYPTRLVSGRQILLLHRWALEARHRVKKDYKIRVNAVVLTAEVIICEQLLGLDRIDALLALIRGIRERRDLTDIGSLLPNNSNRSAAPRAVRLILE